MTTKRYLPPSALYSFFEGLPETVSRKVIGRSVNDLPISLLTLGKGKVKVLMWSQMHGNESTTTRALLDFIPWFVDTPQKHLQEAFTLCVILQLNPDGAQAYTRLNANGIDLNRDAVDLTQPESKVLHDLYTLEKPDYCLNLHGQRTLFAAGKMGETASISFLAPSADEARTVTAPRKKAMQLIVELKNGLQDALPNQIGRYDDAFNPNCVGDKFTQLGTPTVLFEAGHVPNDYQRETTRRHLFKSFGLLLETLLEDNFDHPTEAYYAIPENVKDFVDLIITGVTVTEDGNSYAEQELAIHYKEELRDDAIVFLPEMKFFGVKLPLKAHKKIILPEELKNISLQFKKDNLLENLDFVSLCSIKA
jgi:hypothetical protein